jgi:hypothetical protein
MGKPPADGQHSDRRPHIRCPWRTLLHDIPPDKAGFPPQPTEGPFTTGATLEARPNRDNVDGCIGLMRHTALLAR